MNTRLESLSYQALNLAIQLQGAQREAADQLFFDLFTAAEETISDDVADILMDSFFMRL